MGYGQPGSAIYLLQEQHRGKKRSGRFTPVQIQSVQTSKFHERKQRPNEAVDDYAQELQRLFHRAYATTQHEGRGAETMGKSVLWYQSIAGLRAELKAKVVGCSGDFDALLSKARFEEARLREVRPERNQEKENEHSSGGRQEPPPAQSTPRNRPSGKGDDTCFFCGGLGDYARECPQKRRGLPVESTGKPGKMRSSGQGKQPTAHLRKPLRHQEK